MDEWLTSAEASERTRLSVDTLRYYEKERLITGVKRDGNGHRRYSSADLQWAGLLRRLRATGMTIEQMRSFALLCREPPHAGDVQTQFLREYRQHAEQRLKDAQGALALLDDIVAGFRCTHSVDNKPPTVERDTNTDERAVA